MSASASVRVLRTALCPRSRDCGIAINAAEQDDDRDRGAEPAQVVVLQVDVPGPVRVGEAEDHRSEERQRQAAQPPDDRGRVRVDDQQREHR